MSKKKFTDGLESIFTPDPKAVSGKGTAFLRNPFEPDQRDSDSDAKAKRPSGRKNFTTDLDSLLEEAMQESFQEQLDYRASDDPKNKVFHQQAHRKRPLSGLDMLIRRTVESSTIDIDKTASGTKRLTVAFEKKKLEKLKRIARLEKAYLKDILADIVAEYIRNYEQQKGNIS